MPKLIERLRVAYGSLTAREKQLADLLIQTPGHVLMYSATELSRMAKVSNSTATRLVHSLGYEGYDAMRRSAREELGTEEDGDEVLEGSILQEFLLEERSMQQAALGGLDLEEVEEISDALLAAGNLGFLGIRNSHHFSAYARWQFAQFRPATKLITGMGETTGEHLADLGPGDVVMVIAVRRIVGKMQRYIEAISAQGADVLLITDPTTLHLSKGARWTIVCPVDNPHIFDSYAGILVVLRLLAFRTLQKSGSAGQAYMDTVEKHHDALREFEA